MAPNRFARHRRKTVLAILLAFAFVFDTTGASVYDATARAIERRRMAQMADRRVAEDFAAQAQRQHSNDDWQFRCKSTIFDHGFVPNVSVGHSGIMGFDYPFATNSLGFRDGVVREVPLSKHPRLVFMGDSFTEGFLVSWEQSFAGRVAAALAPEGTDVLNGGVCSYCPSIYYRKMKYFIEERGLELDTLAVFLDISDIHDEGVWYQGYFWEHADDETSERLTFEPRSPEDLDPDLARLSTLGKVKRFVWLHSLAARGLVRLKLALEGGPAPAPSRSPEAVAPVGSAAPEIAAVDTRATPSVTGSPGVRTIGCIDNDRSRWTVDKERFAKYGEKGLRRCGIALDKLAELCRRRGIRLILAVYPWPDQIDAHDVDSIHVQFFRRWAERNGADFMDFFPLFVNDENKFNVYERYYVAGDCHWSAAGHELIAREFLARYRALPRR